MAKKSDDIPKFQNKPEIVAYGLLGQISLLQGIPLYMPNGNVDVINTLKGAGAQVYTTPLTSGSALYYKHFEGYHYLKLVGPNCPKGGGFYLCKKMNGDQFVGWLDSFTRGILLRDIRDKVNNPNAATKALLKTIPNDPFNMKENAE